MEFSPPIVNSYGPCLPKGDYSTRIPWVAEDLTYGNTKLHKFRVIITIKHFVVSLANGYSVNFISLIMGKCYGEYSKK